MNNLLKKLTPPEPLGQCDSNFIGMFQTVRFIQMMSLTFGLFTQVSDSGPLGPLVQCLLVCFMFRNFVIEKMCTENSGPEDFLFHSGYSGDKIWTFFFIFRIVGK